MKRIGSLLLLILLLGITGCGANSTTAVRSYAPQVDTVHVVRFSHINRFPALDVMVSAAAKAQKLSDAIQTLPPFHSWVSCPKDTDLEYLLTFFYKHATLAQITINATGCASVVLGQHNLRGPTQAFWSLFASTLGISMDQVFVQPYLITNS